MIGQGQALGMAGLPKSCILVQETLRDVLLADPVELGRGHLVHDARGVVEGLHDALACRIKYFVVWAWRRSLMDTKLDS